MGLCMLRNTRFFVIAFASTFLLLSGCGGGGSSAGTTGTPTITLSASSLTFPSTIVGQTSAVQTVTVSNTGSGTATISSIAITGLTTNFAVGANTCASTTALAAGASCTINFTFTPQSVGTFSLTITATDNASNSPQTLTLSGTSTGLVPQAVLSATTIAFASTNVGTTSAQQTVTLSNTNGTGPLAISSVVYAGTNPDQFTESSTCGATLAINASCNITATFAPTQIGTFSATVTVTDNAGSIAGSTQVVTLTGTSVGPLVSLSPTALTFAGTTLNTSATAQSVTLTNNGTAALTINSVSLTGTSAGLFSITANTCGTSVAAAAFCTISVNFTPTATGTFTAALSIADNAPGSPQTVSLTGVGQTSPAPIASLAATSISFPNTVPGSTSASMSVTLTNTGGATLNIASIVLGGTNPTFFTQTTTCGTTLASNTSCTISATFSPATTVAYTATVTLTDNNNNVANSTQTITLSGTGGSSTYHTLYVVPMSDNSVTPLYALINNATKTIDMTMYALEDTTFTADLVAACKRGVTVRVILDQNNEKSGNTSAYNSLNAQTGCSAVWANKAFSVTHEKSIMIDGTIDVVMSLNLQSQYYSTTRDYALVDNDANDYAADEATFSMDYAAGTPASGVAGASDFSYQPGGGTDLVWSPTTATTDMLAIINNATKTLYIECEEFSASNIVNAVAAAAQRGVAVVLVGENESNSYTSDYATIKAAGASVYYYSSSTGFYVHAKSVVADQGLSTEAVYMGSINYSSASLTANRELGVYILNNATVSNPLAATIKATTIADESQPGVTHY